MAKILWTKWKVARTIWPYPEGWGIYREHLVNGKRTILETGLPSKEIAQAVADEQNKEKV